jgi:hypothetical protein
MGVLTRAVSARKTVIGDKRNSIASWEVAEGVVTSASDDEACPGSMARWIWSYRQPEPPREDGSVGWLQQGMAGAASEWEDVGRALCWQHGMLQSCCSAQAGARAPAKKSNAITACPSLTPRNFIGAHYRIPLSSCQPQKEGQQLARVYCCFPVTGR